MKDGKIERLEFGYARGYTKALLDVKAQLDSCFSEDLKRHGKRFNAKTVGAALDCMIENRELFRENPFAFLRCGTDGTIEVAISK